MPESHAVVFHRSTPSAKVAEAIVQSIFIGAATIPRMIRGGCCRTRFIHDGDVDQTKLDVELAFIEGGDRVPVRDDLELCLSFGLVVLCIGTVGS